MSYVRLSWILGLLAPVAGVACSSRPARPQDPELTASFERMHAENRFDGAVLVAKGDDILYEGSLGVADDETARRISPETLFDYASISKPITAALALRLARAGRVDLDVPVKNYLMAFPASDITLRHLLTHTSGLLDHIQFFAKHEQETRDILRSSGPVNNADVLRMLVADDAAIAEPAGTSWRYSNIGYSIAVSALEAATGEPIAKLLQSEVFTPAGMKHAVVLGTAGRTGGAPAALAVDYVKTDDSWAPRASVPEWEFVERLGGTIGDGGIAGRPRDLLAFVRSFTSGKLVGMELRDTAFAKAKLLGDAPVRNEGWQVTSYGLGWTLADDGAWVGHTGDWGGFLSYVKYWPATDTTLIYSIHRRRDDWSWLGELEALVVNASKRVDQ
ncbi:MAG: beta-lactamase family protein [Planctomycetes bacterium]|nr:beta-lactamase family protein [Planctomycetota bacterium]MCB9918542.1 beta-lactamase family protein [Planctomycetota bacterium]